MLINYFCLCTNIKGEFTGKKRSSERRSRERRRLGSIFLSSKCLLVILTRNLPVKEKKEEQERVEKP